MKNSILRQSMPVAPVALGVLLLMAAYADAVAAQSRRIGEVTPERLLAEETQSSEWLTGGRNWRQTYHSPLTRIDKQNVKQLGFAWSHDLEHGTNFQATPVVVDGVMFTSGTHGTVYALDAATGALRWSFKPDLEPNRFYFSAHRGVAVWRGSVYVGAADGWLYALNAGTGAIVWKVDTITDRARPYWITGAPYIAKDLVLIGNGGSEWGTRGYVTAYDTRTGKQAWRFFIVPGDPKKEFENPELEMAAKTWDPDSPWEFGGGGNAWDAMAYDPQLNLVYVGAGNGGPWSRRLRSPAGGDNLFLSSIIAIDPDTGRMVWYYQTTPGDDWDWGASQKMILADLTMGDGIRKVIMQAPKNGFFYVLDRATGELLAAKPIVYTNWAREVDLKTGRPVETGLADYSRGPKVVFPMESGGHNWHPMSFSPETGLVYVPVQEAGAIFADLPEKPELIVGHETFGVYYRFGMEWEDGKTLECWPSLELLRADEPDPRQRHYLRAWDPLQQKTVWEVRTSGRAGVISTASGLLFQGDSEGRFRSYDVASGSVLHDLEVGGSMIASPMTYLAKGQQYVAIMAGPSAKTQDGARGRILALKLGGRSVPPPTGKDPTPVPARNALQQPPLPDTGSAADIALGSRLYDSYCGACHTQGARAPDLRLMTREDHAEYLDVVLKGSRAERGMNDFSSVLSETDARAIQAYVLRMAWSRYNQPDSPHAAGRHSDVLKRVNVKGKCGQVPQG